MNILASFRASRGRSAGSRLALAAIAWIALISPPCVMGLTALGPTAVEAAAAHHDCPHCPADAPAEAARDDCSIDDDLTAPRADKNFEAPTLAAGTVPGLATALPSPAARHLRLPLPEPPPGSGPRLHVHHAQFNE